MNFPHETKYLRFEEVPPQKGRKTLVIVVRNIRSGVSLGTISWYGSWRSYVFFPGAQTVFSSDCLADIQACITALMAERKESR
ncbi:MAG: hypothetical protein J5J06_05435 [Phycisphaerae bacterium]|nr:hypothetical protein [Phycisphaerae bacterium]